MEGIEDGRAVDDCPHCVFVDPTVRPCPQCGNRLRYEVAELIEPEQRDESIEAWRRGERDQELLRFLWRLGLSPRELEP